MQNQADQKITIVVPAYNEENSIEKVISKLTSLFNEAEITS